MSGLKELWGLGDPAMLDPRILQRYEAEMVAFAAILDRLNSSLQYTAVSAPLPSHGPLDQRRGQIIAAYQKAITSQGDARRALESLLSLTNQLAREASQLVETTRSLKQSWEGQSQALASAEEAVAQSTEATPEIAKTQQGLGKIAEAIKARDYQTALDQLGAIAGAAQPSAGPAASPGGGPVNERRYLLGGKLEPDPVVPRDPEQLANWDNPLVNGDPRELFTTERMDAVVEMHFAGEGTTELNTAMNAVLFAQPGEDVSQHLETIGKQRGLEPAVVKAQYERFRQLQSVAAQSEAARGLTPDDAMNNRRQEYQQTHGKFLGNQSSLRFGQVVGEATGLDPAFAAMLNPTGGMVGPGMDVLAPTDANSPVIWHGIFHDAGGYLLNYQNSGPGYTYLADKQPASGRRGADPFQGQVEGISYWYERKQPNRSVLEDLYEFDFTAEDSRDKELLYDRYVKHPITDADGFAKQLSEDAVNEVRDTTADARQFNRDSVDSLKGSARAAADAVQEKIGEADQAVDSMADTARRVGVNKELVAAAHVTLKTQLAGMHSQVEVWQQGSSAAFDSAGRYVEDNLDAVERWADEAGAALREKTSTLATELEAGIHSELVELAQDKDIQDGLQRGANSVGETAQDVKALAKAADREVEKAKQEVNRFYDEAMASLDKGVGRAEQELTKVKDNLIDKLSKVRDTTNKVVDGMVRKVDSFASGVAQTGQDVTDAAAGVADSLENAVSGGTDTLAHARACATDFAADSLERLTNLLG